MSFACAYISLLEGAKVKRKHWNGYWKLEGDEIIVHTYNDQDINLREVSSMRTVIANAAFDDWEIVN